MLNLAKNLNFGENQQIPISWGTFEAPPEGPNENFGLFFFSHLA